jgi:hypothetical protein
VARVQHSTLIQKVLGLILCKSCAQISLLTDQSLQSPMTKMKLCKSKGGQEPLLFWVQVNLQVQSANHHSHVHAITGSNRICSTDVPTSEIYVSLFMWEQTILGNITHNKNKHGNTAASQTVMCPL